LNPGMYHTTQGSCRPQLGRAISEAGPCQASVVTERPPFLKTLIQSQYLPRSPMPELDTKRCWLSYLEIFGKLLSPRLSGSEHTAGENYFFFFRSFKIPTLPV